MGWVQWTPRDRFCILESRMCPNVPGTPKPSIFIEVHGMSTNTHHVFFCCGGGEGRTCFLNPVNLVGPGTCWGSNRNNVCCVGIFMFVLHFQDSQLAEWGLGSVYGSIPLRFLKKQHGIQSKLHVFMIYGFLDICLAT